jgi:hypothetical protein
MVFYTVIAAEHHAGHEAQQFLGFYIQGAGCIGVAVKVPEPFDDEVVIAEDHLIHPEAVVVEFFYRIAHIT